YLQRLAGRPAAVVRFTLPIDLAFFAETRRRPLTENPVFAFVGRLGYVPNRDALRRLVSDVWPVLHTRWPNARLRVIGAGAGRAIAARPDHEVLIAETPEDFRRQAERLVTGDRAELAAAAKTWVQTHHATALFERDVLETCASITAEGERQAVRYD